MSAQSPSTSVAQSAGSAEPVAQDVAGAVAQACSSDVAQITDRTVAQSRDPHGAYVLVQGGAVRGRFNHERPAQVKARKIAKATWRYASNGIPPAAIVVRAKDGRFDLRKWQLVFRAEWHRGAGRVLGVEVYGVDIES